MNYNEVILLPPPGVAINQWKNGSLHFKCGPDGYMPLAHLFAQLSVQCQTYAEAYKTATQQVTDMGAAPMAQGAVDRIAQMEAEIARLRNAGMPVSVNTNPTLTPAQQLAAAVVTRSPVTVAAPGPSLLEVAASMASRGVQHPAAAMMAVAVPAPIIPPANVPPQPPVPPHIAAVSVAHQNPGPALASPAAPAAPPAPLVHTSSVAHQNPGPAIGGLPPAPVPAPVVVAPVRRTGRIAQLQAELAALQATTEEPAPIPQTEAAPIIHRPILRQPAPGVAAPDAPNTVITGGREADDGELGPPPDSV